MAGETLHNGHATATAAFNNNLKQWEEWDEETVLAELRKHRLSDSIVNAFSNEKIKGRCLPALNFYILMHEMKLSYRECLEVKEVFVKIGCWQAPPVGNLKIFNDPIHGNIRLHPVCLAVIDTPQFQRLRYVKQLGLCYFVYPGAAHNRFEHSLGVCHLAGQFIRTLQENQPELGIDDKDVLCLELAGLCHDMGHGPFSHVFDARFIPAVLKNRAWKHEKASSDMFEHVIREHGLMEEGGIFQQYGLTEKDIDFVKELMAGPNKRGFSGWPYEGREKPKAYLYEIVANKRNCIDVDKWDYIARDCYQLGISNNFDHTRFIKFARVIEVNGEMQICVRDKENLNLYNMFSTRYTLHKNAYQHKVNCALDIMVEQALIKANKHVKIKGENGKRLKISECIDDMTAYTQLTDNILFKILDTECSQAEPHETSPEESVKELEAAKNLIKRIFNRDLFKCIHETTPLGAAVLEGIDEAELQRRTIGNCSDDINVDDFFIKIVDLDFGMKDENPVEKLNIYSKNTPDEARHLPKHETSRILAPYAFKEQLVRIYVCDRHNETKHRAIQNAWNEWFPDHQREIQEKYYEEPKKDQNEEQNKRDQDAQS